MNIGNNGGQREIKEKIIDEKEVEKMIRSRENEIRKKCTDYENCVKISEMLSEEIPKNSSVSNKIVFLGESINIYPKNEDEYPKTPDLIFAYDSEKKGILVEIKSSLPSRHSANYERNMLNRLCDLKKYFQEMKEFDEHEVWLIVSEHDYGSVIEFVYEKNYQELDFLRNSDFSFALWYFCTKDKRGKEGLFINHRRGEIYCPLIDERKSFYSESVLLLGNKAYFVSDKPPAVEYTMMFILDKIIPYLGSLVERGEYPEEKLLYLTNKELMERIREIRYLTISGDNLDGDWIKDALEKLSQINVLKKDESTGTPKYGFPIKFRSRRIGQDVYKTFAEREIALDLDLRIKSREIEDLSPTRMPYIPNANALPIIEFVETVVYHGGLTTIETLKKTLHKDNIHHERTCSSTLGFTESPFINYVRVTDLGAEFADSGEFTKRKTFHKQAMKTVKLYKIIYDNLSDEKSLKSEKIEQIIQKERKRAGLEEYSESSISENAKTLMNWMKYTGNAKRRRGYYSMNIPLPILTKEEYGKNNTIQLSLEDFISDSDDKN
jgi:hypothetical protein